MKISPLLEILLTSTKASIIKKLSFVALFFSFFFYFLYEVQNIEVKNEFKELRAHKKNDLSFALAVNKKIHERHKNYNMKVGGQDNSWSFKYRSVHYILNGGGLCAHRSLLFITAMREFGIKARKRLIGLDGRDAHHIVAEAFIDKKWRVFDPLFGYTYRTSSGEVATALKLKRLPILVMDRVRSDKTPFPRAYPLKEYHYNDTMLFNWWKSSLTRWLLNKLGPSLKEWEPPYILNRPFSLLSILCVLVFLGLRLGLRNSWGS